MSKLDDILEDFGDGRFQDGAKDWGFEMNVLTLEGAKEQIKDLTLEIVRGEYHYQDSADDLLIKIVKKVSEL